MRCGGVSGTGWAFTGANKTIIAGTSHIIFTNEFTNGAFRGFQGDNMDVYHHVSTLIPTSPVAFSFSANVHVQKLEVAGNMDVKEDCSFDTLILNGGKKYNFTSSINVDIVELIQAASDACTVNASLETAGYTKLMFGGANLNIDGGAVVDIDAAFISGVNASGPNAPFIVTNCIDNGGNIGLDFSIAPLGKTLYWVGGAGDWNDVSHWSELNDGVYSPTSGGCVPTPADTVVFNSNSGFSASNNTVTLNGSGHYCRNMKWDNAAAAPELIGGVNNILRIYGSLELQSVMKYNVHSTYFHSSSQTEKITTNGVVIGIPGISAYAGNLFFNGTGMWTLQDDLTTGGGISVPSAGCIYFYKGHLNTNGKELDIHAFISSGSGTRELTLGASKITIRSDHVNNAGWNYSGVH